MKTRTLLLVVIALIPCLLLASISVMAQTSTTGNIEGTVTDSNGEIVPGATVVISGGRLLRSLKATSNDEGFYSIGNIPPGKYRVKVEASAELAGFEENDVEVRLSRTTTVDITLKPKGEEATVDVPTDENQRPARKEEPAAATKSKYSVAELTIRERQAGDVTILDLEGKITDGGGATALRNAVRGLLDEGKKKILLNCKAISYVDEDGVGTGAMVAGFNATNAEGGALKLLNLPDSLRDVLGITKLLTVFETFDDQAKALASF